jgi:hypothetical protein
MADPVDVYADQFQVVSGPFGWTLNFSVTDPTPAAPGTPPKSSLVGSVRMSAEHLKAMAFLVARQLRAYERTAGVTVEVPVSVLNQLGIGPEDWKDFWK